MNLQNLLFAYLAPFDRFEPRHDGLAVLYAAPLRSMAFRGAIDEQIATSESQQRLINSRLIGK